MALEFRSKQLVGFIILVLILTNLSILLNISVLRQAFGFLFLTLVPGLLILQILKLNKIELTERLVLSVGLSISFLMFFGLMINNLSLSLGYLTPLSTISLLITFNLAAISLILIAYRMNKNAVFSLPDFNLSTSEKAFLIVPILFPALSIFGMHVMNTIDNNIILMLLLFLIPIYVIFVCFFNHKFPKRLYPIVICLISISLLLILMLRFPHIFGRDVHIEYYYFQTTLDNLHWKVVGYSALDACLSISLLPAIFQSIMNVNAQEYLFKGVYVSICSFGPLAIYILSKKYIDEIYAFLASFFFMSQLAFLSVAGSPRTNLAIFFVALAVMVFFSDKIDPLKRRFLFIVFILSVAVSHYSTTYIFFFILLGAFAGIEILSKKFTFKKGVSLTIVILFFAFIFFWYSQVTETAFNAGVNFIGNTIENLNRFFLEESRASGIERLYGQGLTYPILSRVNLVVTWCTFILIGIGVLSMIIRYKEMMNISNVKVKKPDFLKTKFEMEYLAIVLGCAGVSVLVIALPYVSVGYQLERTYSLAAIILSCCFVIGGMTLSKHFFFFVKRKPVLKEKQKSLTKNVSQQPQNGLQVRAYLIILLILMPYFLFTTGAMYQLWGAPVSITLNSGGEKYEREYLHDQESCGAKWLKDYGELDRLRKLHTDSIGEWKLISQGGFSPFSIDSRSFFKHKNIRGYIYLSYFNIVNKTFTTGYGLDKNIFNVSDYADMFIGKNKIYDNRGSEVWG